MIIISLKNNSKYAKIIERKFAKKEKKRKENKLLFSQKYSILYCMENWKK